MPTIIVHHQYQHTPKPYNHLLIHTINLQQATIIIPAPRHIQKPSLSHFPRPIPPLPQHRVQLHLPSSLLHHQPFIVTKRTLPVYDMEEIA